MSFSWIVKKVLTLTYVLISCIGTTWIQVFLGGTFSLYVRACHAPNMILQRIWPPGPWIGWPFGRKNFVNHPLFDLPLWWISNSRRGLLKYRDVMKGIPFVDVDYCQFSDWGYQNPTRIWCCPPTSKLKSVLCDPKVCRHVVTNNLGLTGHRERLGGNQVKAKKNSVV